MTGNYDLSKASVTRWGKSVMFEEPGRYPILSLHGSYYEKGYAIGKFLNKRLYDILAMFVTAASAMNGGWEPDGHTPPTKEQIDFGRERMNRHIENDMVPAVYEQYPQFMEMVKGELDGLKDSGYEMTLDDLLILNMVSESFFWFHGCSSFSAWGSATKDGELIHAMNLDQESYGLLHKNIVLMAEENDDGFSVLGPTYLGCVFEATFLNSAGISYGEMTSMSTIEEWPMMPHYCQAKLIANSCDTLDKVIEVSKKTGGTTGWVNLFSQCAPKKDAAAVETAGKLVGVRRPIGEFPEMLFATNHFRAFPGWKGYEGPNLMEEQFRFFVSEPRRARSLNIDGVSWEEVDTPEKWEKIFRCPRFELYKDYLMKNHGKIDVEHAIEIQTMDPIGMGDVELAPAPEICGEFDQLYGRRDSLRLQSLRSVYSCVMKPESGEIWLATGKAPAQAAPFVRTSLKEVFDRTAALK